MNVGTSIKIARTRRGVTQKALAARLGITRSYLSLVEGGKKMPSFRLLSAISSHLGVPLRFLVSPPEQPAQQEGDPEVELLRRLLEAVLDSLERLGGRPKKTTTGGRRACVGEDD